MMSDPDVNPSPDANTTFWIGLLGGVFTAGLLFLCFGFFDNVGWRRGQCEGWCAHEDLVGVYTPGLEKFGRCVCQEVATAVQRPDLEAP